MDIDLFFRGLLIGFSIAAPVGAIGVLCIKRTLVQGSLVGFVSGLGAATADGIYACIAGFGLTFVSSFLINQQYWFRLIGGLFLCYLGIKSCFTKPSKTILDQNTGLFRAYLSTFFLTLTNPTTILAFVTIFSGLGLVNTSANYSSATVMILGVFVGSALWWLILSCGVAVLITNLTLEKLRLLNCVSGAIISAFGLWALLNLNG